MVEVHIGLVHWPVLDRSGRTVATNVTHFDVHDIARAAKTYGVKKYFILNPLREQLMYVSRILNHWKVEVGLKYNPKRREALDLVETVEDLDQLLLLYSSRPLIIATAARVLGDESRWTFSQLKTWIHTEPERSLLLLFGTGNGLHPDLLAQCDGVLESIHGSRESLFRHLSVRSAASIVLDRLLSEQSPY